MSNRLIPIAAILVAIGIFFGYVNPAWNGSVAATKAAIATDNQALAAAKEYTSRQKELSTSRDAIEPANLARLTSFLPDSVDNVGTILDLNALAARSGLSLSGIDVAANSTANVGSTAGGLPASGTSPTGSVDLSVSAVGTYSALQEFLDGVERSQRLLDVRGLSVKGSDTGVYSYQMTLRLYWLR